MKKLLVVIVCTVITLTSLAQEKQEEWISTDSASYRFITQGESRLIEVWKRSEKIQNSDTERVITTVLKREESIVLPAESLEFQKEEVSWMVSHPAEKITLSTTQRYSKPEQIRDLIFINQYNEIRLAWFNSKANTFTREVVVTDKRQIFNSAIVLVSIGVILTIVGGSKRMKEPIIASIIFGQILFLLLGGIIFLAITRLEPRFFVVIAPVLITIGAVYLVLIKNGPK